MKSSTAEDFFSLVSLFASEGKRDERKEFTIAEGTIKVCYISGLKILKNVSPIAFIYKSFSFGSMLSTVSNDGDMQLKFFRLVIPA